MKLVFLFAALAFVLFIHIPVSSGYCCLLGEGGVVHCQGQFSINGGTITDYWWIKW